MRVLIVEDDASARRGLTELVRAWGHEAEGAADGQEGLEKITTYRPSVVLADMVMPRMDGLELLRRVREQLGEITYVLITAQGSVDTAVSAMKEGAYDYLTKPVDPQRLRTLLTHVAEREDALRDVTSLRRQLQDHGLSRHRAGGPDGGIGTGLRGVRNRQGARRQDDPPAQRAQQASVHRD
jgi:DNA-binding NtrC family response regulator